MNDPMTINPATLYTILVGVVVVAVMVTTWCLDRLAESRKRERALQNEIDRLQ